MTLKRIGCALGALAGLFAEAAEPLCVFPLDGTGEAVVRPGGRAAKGVVYGREAWAKGVSGQGLDVRRHAYDQVTCFVADRIEGVSTKAGTVAFWFRPHWAENEPEAHWIVSAHEVGWKPWRFYMVKGANGVLDLSLCAPGQVQIRTRNVFKKDVWSHLAFTWDAPTGTLVLYVDGKEAARRTLPEAFTFPAPTAAVQFACGDGSSDRFKAKVGDGVYDDVRLYDAALPAAEVLQLALAGSAEKMAAAPFPGLSFAFACPTNRYASARQLLRLSGNGGRLPQLTLSTTGASGRLTLVLKTAEGTASLESADTFDLRVPCAMSFDVRGGRLAWKVAGAEQGRVPFAGAAADFAQASCARGVAFAPPPATAAFARRDRLALRAGEERLWDLSDAQRRADGARRGVTLNGYWRVQPVDDFTPAPPSEDWRHVRVPGSFRSPLWGYHRLVGGRISDEVSHRYGGRDIGSYRAAWYQRGFATPARAPGERVWLNFENLNGDTGRVYLNGWQVCAFRRSGKIHPAVPNGRRIDVTDALARDGGLNVLSVYVDRHYIGLWRGRPAIGDHGEIALGDVWLEAAPGRTALAAGVALPSFRARRVTLRARLANPSGETGRARVRFDFVRDGKVAFSAARDVALTGEDGQRLVWTAPWKDPVLWNVETPNVYAMRVSLVQDGRTADTLPERPFGFREAWAEKGQIWLNGVPTRLRMWTSPGLNRVRYYYGADGAVAQYVAHVREMNYDTVRFDPFGKTSQVGWTPYLTACDTIGLYNLFPMPPYEDEEREGYAADVDEFLDCYGNHPSVIMWYTDFNTCSYPWNQDPAKLTDLAYAPSWTAPARARVQVAEAVMRARDPSREIFQHAGGSSGRIFTSMNYQSYGTPLQEQEDWPAQWAANPVRPLMVVESAFPYPAQLRHFDDAKLGSLVPEHAARYFGDAVYGRETEPVPYYSEWAQSVVRPFNANLRDLAASHCRRVVKAWRGYGMSALGDFPGARDMMLTARTFDRQNVVWSRSADVKTAGLKPDCPEGDSETQRHLLTDYSLPDYLHDVVREAYAPLLVFLAGDPKDFTNKDHAYFAGERVVKGVVAVNDHTTPRRLDCRWRLLADGEVVARGECAFDVAAGGIVKEPIAFAAPAVCRRTQGTLSVEVVSEGRLVRAESLGLEFWPAEPPPAWTDVDCALYDPAGRTASVLRRANFPFRTIARPEELGESRLLVVGALALDGTNALLRALEESGRFDGGLKVLVFEQRPGTLPGFAFTAPSARDAFALQPSSPYLKGLADEDFRDWRGATDILPAFALSDERSPHYPRSKWKCGNGGVVCGAAIKRPSRGNFRTLVACGFDLASAALLEYRRAHGLALFCQLDVTARYGKDPAATHLVHNILRSMSSRFVPVGPQRACYLGDDAGAATLEKLGVAFTRAPSPEAAAGAQVLLLGPGAVPPGREAALRACVARAGAAVFLPGAPLDALPDAVRCEERCVFRASPPAGEPLFAGIPQADLYFRTPRALPVYAGGPGWLAAASPALFGRLRNCVLMPPAPERMEGPWSGEKMARVWSAILAELNVGLAPDARLFVAERAAPYAVAPNPYDGDAFHNW